MASGVVVRPAMDNRHVIVTGGAGGVGLAVVETALARGARVTVPHLGPDGLDRIRARLGEPDGLTFVPCDLTQEDAVAELLGRPHDALIHLMGGFTMAPVHEMSFDAFRNHVTLQLMGTFLCCKHALRHMRETGYGRIVTVGSKAVEAPMANVGAYASGKAGVVALTRTVAEETKSLADVTANCVLPSVVDTPANRAAMGDEHVAEWVSPSGFAETVCFLASAAARDLRGAVIPIYAKS